MIRKNKKSTAKKKSFRSKKVLKKEQVSEEAVDSAPIEASPDKKEAKEAEEAKEQPSMAADEKEAEDTKKKKKSKFLSFQKKAATDDEIIKKKKPKSPSSIGTFFASLNNIGMGKQAFLFAQSVATMLNAGLPLLDSLRIFQAETRGRAMKKIIENMVTEIEDGTPFWHAMDNRHLFSPYDIAMVRIGEEAGSLAQNMEYLAEQKEKDRELKQKVKMAMIYPTIVLTMMFVIIIGLGLFVLPNLVQVLFSLNVDLPFMTRVVIYIANIFSKHGKVFVPLLIAFMIVLGLLGKFTGFRVVVQWVTFHIPGVGRLAREATIARFGVILGGLLKAGVPFIDALESLAEVTHVSVYKKFYKRLLDRARVGDSFSKGFEEIKESKKLLPVSVQQLVVAGERSGSLADSLLKVATIYEKKASETAQALPIILEPLLLLFIGGLVGGIAFAIIVPIYSVVGNIGSS